MRIIFGPRTKSVKSQILVYFFVVCLQNSPQFIWVANPELELQFHYKIHTSLDIIEEKLCNTGSSEVKKLYLGLLHSTEEYKMYSFYICLIIGK